MLYKDLEQSIKDDMNQELIKAFDEITFDNQYKYIMNYRDNYTVGFEDFSVSPENIITKEYEDDLLKRKIRLFTYGVILYKVDDDYNIIKYIDARNGWEIADYKRRFEL